MERNQQAGRLQIIRYPELPHDPVSPKKLKWLAVIFALAGMIGAGSVFAAEMLDGSIRSPNELAGIIDRRLDCDYPLSIDAGRGASKTAEFHFAVHWLWWQHWRQRLLALRSTTV